MNAPGYFDADPEDVLRLLRCVYLDLHPESRASASQLLADVAARHAGLVVDDGDAA